MMIATHIMVGHDGSRDAETAFEGALDLAALARARLSVVSVASPPEPPRGRSAIAEWVSGSTSRRVVAHAKGPVLVVRAR
jgi:nucleotide-binding universal stress UspA family protein